MNCNKGHSHEDVSGISNPYNDTNKFGHNNGIVCRQYTPEPHSDQLIVPIIPKADQHKVLHQCHDVPKAGHVGSDKTAMKVRQLGYWVEMLHDINQYCSEYVTCQSSKPPATQKVPLINIPIGKPWEMVAGHLSSPYIVSKP